MGGCISTPGKTILRRKSKDSAKSSTTKSDLHAPHHPQKPSFVRPINVIEDPAPNNIFQKYEFGKELGRGEFGVTHRCVEIETGRAYACKKIAKTKLRTDIDVQDVKREVQIMRHLPKHPNIVSFKEAYEDQDAVYLVMELCEGGELFDRIVSKGHYTERAAANVIKTILEICKVSLHFHLFGHVFVVSSFVLICVMNIL